MKRILEWYFNKQLKWKKRRILNEVLKDITFIERCRADLIDRRSVDTWRNEMASLRKAEKPNLERLEFLMTRISDAEAAMGELEKLRRVARELPEFIEML